ncbi:MAG: thioredoxin domain-containing protein [Candidatus Omnitrophica bacterium]|nr:thioredoxin domain-containing protein [Candidatus Omnitrophota bacterium]
MDNRLFTLVIVAVLAIMIGLGVVSKQTREPMLREILKQQAMMLKNHEVFLSQAEEDANSSALRDELQTLKLTQQAFEQRITALEMQFKQFQAGGRPAAAQARQQPPQRPQEDYTKVHDIPVAHSQIKGNKDAKVTIVMFVDFQCPFSARFYPPLQQVLKAYPDDSRVIIKHFPLAFHKQAQPAAKAILAAGLQGKYWEMTDRIFELNSSGLSDDKFKELAGSIGMDVDKFMNDYKEKDAEWEKMIQADMNLGSQVGVRGTPTFFLNGRKTRARTFEAYKQEIDQVLKK